LIDGYFGTDPYGMITCILLGVGGGFARLIQMLRRFDRVDRDAVH
jgi:F0F1-type ATP synthase assembly protein I